MAEALSTFMGFLTCYDLVEDNPYGIRNIKTIFFLICDIGILYTHRPAYYYIIPPSKIILDAKKSAERIKAALIPLILLVIVGFMMVLVSMNKEDEHVNSGSTDYLKIRNADCCI